MEDKMVKEKKETKEKKVEVKQLNIQRLQKGNITVKIKGVTPYLASKMDMISVDNIERKKNGQMVVKDVRTEDQKTEDKIHHTPDGKVGIPSAAFMKGMVECAPYLDGLDKKRVTGSVRIFQDIIPIKFKKQAVHETWGINAGMTKAPKIIRRPMFSEWECELNIMFNAANITAEQIVNLLNWSGFQMGVGGWRAQKGGAFGQYEVLPGQYNKV